MRSLLRPRTYPGRRPRILLRGLLAVLIVLPAMVACGSASSPPASFASTLATSSPTYPVSLPTATATGVPTQSPTSPAVPTVSPTHSAEETAIPSATAASVATTQRTTPTTSLQSEATISIDPDVTYQTMMGFGTSERVWDDPHVVDAFDPATQRGLQITRDEEDELLDRLYLDLGLTRVRAIIEQGIEVENDNADPYATELSGFNFAWKRVDAHVDYAKRATARGLTTPWFSPLMLEPWMPRDLPAEAAEWLLAIMIRWREFGVEVPYIAVINEPGYERSGLWSGEQLRDVIKNLGPRMRVEGFTTQIVITDDLNPTEAYERSVVILADEDARQYVGALAYHLYGGAVEDRQRIAELGARYNLPIWMTEYAEPANALAWAGIVHELITVDNVSAVDAQWGFFGEWDRLEAHLITLFSDGTRYLGYELTKMYYVTGQFSRFVRPGAKRVLVNDGGWGVKVSAYRDGDQIILVAINETQQDTAVTVRLSGDRSLGDLSATRTSDTENWVELPVSPTHDGMVPISLPPRSVTTLRARMTTSGSGTCFPETGTCLGDTFASFWQDNGGLAVLGFPITSAVLESVEGGAAYTVQYFERQRLEWHPENAGTPYEVLLGRLGVLLLSLKGRDWTTEPRGDPLSEHYFSETGHAILPEFWDYWSRYGLQLGDPGVSLRESIALFGYPITEPRILTNSSGDAVLIQWFERARFEYHPANPVLYDVLLGRLGNELLEGMNIYPAGLPKALVGAST